jgi:cell division septum initiation protein DivIVA
MGRNRLLEAKRRIDKLTGSTSAGDTASIMEALERERRGIRAYLWATGLGPTIRDVSEILNSPRLAPLLSFHHSDPADDGGWCLALAAMLAENQLVERMAVEKLRASYPTIDKVVARHHERLKGLTERAQASRGPMPELPTAPVVDDPAKTDADRIEAEEARKAGKKPCPDPWAMYDGSALATPRKLQREAANRNRHAVHERERYRNDCEPEFT